VAPYPKAIADFPKVRQSLLATFDACGLATRFELEHRQGWSSHRAALGQIVHRTLARCFEAMEDAGEEQIPVDVAMTIYDEVIRQADVPLEGDHLGDEDVPIPLRLIAEGRIIVKTFALYTRWSVSDFVGIERRYDTILTYPDGNGGHVERVFTTKPDLVMIGPSGEHATVVDHKTGWGLPPEHPDTVGDDALSEGGYFQQRAHALVVFRAYPRVQRVTSREFYPRYASGTVTDRKGQPLSPVREATIDRWALPEVEAEMSALIERFDRAYESSVWRPSPGTHCAYCVRPEACTIFPGARVEGRIGSQVEAERLAGRLQVLDALKRQTTKALRAWSDAHGDVRVKDAKRPRVYGPVVRDQRVTPTPEEVRAAVARGEDPAGLYGSKQVVSFVVHTPEEEHPHAAAARREEEALLAMERAADERRKARTG
jgi:hypothetical protein